MEEVPVDQGVASVIDSILGNRLAILAGAGLSMAPPSSLPSAAAIAWAAQEKYAGLYGNTRPPLPPGIEEQAEYFFQRGELETVYFRTLVDQHAFASPPNPGHYAIADLLLVNAIQTAITTNVDALIEMAGRCLFGEIGVGIDGLSVATVQPALSPLLKIHGCYTRDPANMVWAPGQLKVNPVAARIGNSATWLNGRLLDRDLLIVGYSTDWEYLNAVLAATLGAVRPARVVVVNLAPSGDFAARAPELHALGERASINFRYVQASGDEFLGAVRQQFSKMFVRQALHSGVGEYTARVGAAPDVTWTEPMDADNDTLWRIRRDLEGCSPNRPATLMSPPAGNLLGLTLLQLRAAGAVSDGQFWLLDGRRIRVLRASDKSLHVAEGEYNRELAPLVAPDIVVAVGAERRSLPPNIARADEPATIARGSRSSWLTRQEAEQELKL
jgi:hypothetical protein